MRITRAAKVAAFPLIVLALVALVACQGGPGIKGEKGDTGDTGDMGTMGDSGTNAPIPLTGRDGAVLFDSLNAGRDMNEVTEFEIDLHAAGYFNGGEAPYKYTWGAIPARNGTPALEVSVDEDTNMLKLKLTSASASDYSGAEPWTDGYKLPLMAKDANKESAPSSITIKPNRAPVLQDGLTETDNVLNTAVLIGTLDDKVDTDTENDEDNFRAVPDANATCKTMNSCEFDLFDDEGSMKLSAVADPAGKLSFKDEGDGKLTIMGLEAHAESIAVDVTAVDDAGEESTFRVLIVVDAAPTISEDGQAVSKTIKISVGGNAATAIFNTEDAAENAFADADDGQDISVTFTSGNMSIVTVTSVTGGRLMGVGRGTATVTMRGSSGTLAGAAGLGQYAEIEFTVIVE